VWRALSSSALLAAIVFLGSSCKPSPAPLPSAELVVADGGAAKLVVGSRSVDLPSGEVELGAPKVIVHPSGKRFAYVTAKHGPLGEPQARMVYAIGDGLWLGATPAPPAKPDDIPDLEDAASHVVERAEGRSAALAADLKKELGEGGVARFLVWAAGAEGPAWDAIFASLPPARQEETRAGLAELLRSGKRDEALPRIVRMVKLTDAAVLDARIRRALEPTLVRPFPVAVLERALGAIDPARAAGVACAVLRADTPPPDRPAGYDAAVEAALLAIAEDALAGKPLACEAEVAAALERGSCSASLRCAAGKPLTGRETTKQDEALCNKAELAAAVKAARSEPPTTALEGAVRPSLFAYAALLAANKVPASFEQAHARRRFEIVQPKEPACESGVALGAPCHCDEAVLRDLACRNLASASGHVGVCKFEIDDKQKKITNVTSAIGP